MFGCSELAVDRFTLVLFLTTLFFAGWAMLYELFYGGAFLNNNQGLFGGLCMTMISVALIILPVHGFYDLFQKGILGQVIQDFFRVALLGIIVAAVIGAVLKIIDYFVKKWVAT